MMASTRLRRFRLYGLALASCVLATFFSNPAGATPQRWYRWEQNLLDLSEILGAMHYMNRLCGDPRDPLWRDRMIELVRDQDAEGERQRRLVSRFNRGHTETRRRYDRCTLAVRFKMEQMSLIGEDLIVWFRANTPL